VAKVLHFEGWIALWLASSGRRKSDEHRWNL